LDDYYYYAFCIALISIMSITSTLVETKKVSRSFSFFETNNPNYLYQTVARMREMSRLICTMDTLKDGTCEIGLTARKQGRLTNLYFSGVAQDSTQLVPGDIVNLSSSQFSLVPADLFLISGDAIVNESMLTGESVPVSKAPVKDEDIIKWRDVKTENAKTFLYSGTRVVRIRGTFKFDGQGRPALAVVARTGELCWYFPLYMADTSS
jgi:cation-transporting ATPase 13A3/4/5